MPEFYMIITRKIFFPFFLGGGVHVPPLPLVSYACSAAFTVAAFFRRIFGGGKNFGGSRPNIRRQLGSLAQRDGDSETVMSH